MVRFNEAIDQALAESVAHFDAHVQRERNLFLGVVSHDLRSPLQTIHVTASHLAAINADETISVAASRLIKSGKRMQALLDDLVQFNRVNLGVGIQVAPATCDLREAFSEEVDLLRAALEGREVTLDVSGDCDGSWDAVRLRQMLANLVQNAVQHGSRTDAIRVRVIGEPNGVIIEVENRGPVLSEGEIQGLFEPLRRGPAHGASSKDSGLGLGLFIVREIAKAHGGAVDARSNEGGTVFTAYIPRLA